MKYFITMILIIAVSGCYDASPADWDVDTDDCSDTDTCNERPANIGDAAGISAYHDRWYPNETR